MDTVLVWLRYVHAALVPIAIFALHKDLRKKAATLIMCWRPNSVESRRNHHHISPFVQNHETPRELKIRFRSVIFYFTDISKNNFLVTDYNLKRHLETEKKQKKFKNVTNYR